MSFESGNKESFDQSRMGTTYKRLAGTVRFTIDGVKFFAIIVRNNMAGENSNSATWTAEKSEDNLIKK